MNEFETVFVSDLVGQTCEAAVDPMHWNTFVATLERAYPESRITLFGHDNGCPTANLAAAVNYPADALKDYAAHYASRSPYIARHATLPLGRAYDYDTVVRERELRQTEYYNDYLRPYHLGHYGTGLIIDRHGPLDRSPRGTVISLIHHRTDTERLERQARLLDLLSPHLRRAMRLHRAIAAERARASATQAAFDHWPHAVVVLEPSGRVVTHNHAAETLFRTGRIWIGRGGRLCTADDGKTRMLELAVRKCATLPDRVLERAPELDGIALPSASDAPPLRVAVWPLPAGANPVAPRAGVLMVIFDPAHAQHTPVGWLAQQFGLLPSEQRLTEAIMSGMPLAQAAEQLGIRLSTARTRLKAIQIKTGCRRQVDLVRLALSLSAVRQQ